jgi:hypothetical protein
MKIGDVWDLMKMCNILAIGVLKGKETVSQK